MKDSGSSTNLSRYEFAAKPSYVRRLMQDYAALFDRGPVADLGCGRGFFLEALRRRGLVGIGVDISDEAIDYAASLGFQCVQSDVFEYLATAHDLGGVFASHLIEHLGPADAERLVAEMTRVIRPGGSIAVVTPNMKDWRTLTETFWLDATHIRPYPPALIAAWMTKVGLTVDELGRGRTPSARRKAITTFVGRLRFGSDFGVTEVFVRAHKPLAEQDRR